MDQLYVAQNSGRNQEKSTTVFLALEARSFKFSLLSQNKTKRLWRCYFCFRNQVGINHFNQIGQNYLKYKSFDQIKVQCFVTEEADIALKHS